MWDMISLCTHNVIISHIQRTAYKRIVLRIALPIIVLIF